MQFRFETVLIVAYLQVIGMEDSELRRKKMTLKTLVITNFDGLVIIDQESLVGQYASLQHLELGCEDISIRKAKDAQALVPLEGQSCNLILQTTSKLESRQEASLLSLGFRSIPNNNPPAKYQFPNRLIMQYEAPERVSPPQSIRSSLYYPFERGISTSFGRGSEEYTLLASKGYQAFLYLTPYSLCFDDKRIDWDEEDEWDD